MKHLKGMVILLLWVYAGFTAPLKAATVFPVWLSGEWHGQVGGGIYHESWRQCGENELIGTASLEKEGRTLSQESIRLEQIGSHIVYIVALKDQPPVMFTLKPQTVETQWVFENMQHDYPQRIIYTQKSATKLVAVVEGLIDGKMESEEFALEKK